MYSEYLMKMGHQEEVKQGIARIEKSISPAKQKPSLDKALVLNETIDSIKKQTQYSDIFSKSKLQMKNNNEKLRIEKENLPE